MAYPARRRSSPTLLLLFRGTVAKAQSRNAAGDRTHLVAVDRLAQVLHAVQAEEVRTLGNEGFFA